MSLTNADLKWLKTWVNNDAIVIEARANEMIPALIARLEAAELIVDEFKPYGNRQVNLLKSWKKAAGK